MTIDCASRRGPREACYELRECACARSAAYSRFALLPMYSLQSQLMGGFRVQAYTLLYGTHTFDNHPLCLVLPSFPLVGGERGFTLASFVCPLIFR